MRDEQIPALARRVRLRWDDVRGEHVLLFPEGVMKLNASAAEALLLVDGARTLRAIADALAGRYPDAGRAVIVADLTALFGEIASHGFLVLSDEAP